MKFGPVYRTKRHRGVLGAITVALLGPAVVLADDRPVTPFQMGVVEDQAYGRSIQTGKYERAIAKLAQRASSGRAAFYSQNNLCVAYAKTAEFGKAMDACDAAVNEMKTLEARASKRSRRSLESESYRSDLAVALSNRGVLHAVSGDVAQARADFQASMALESRHGAFAVSNLERLDTDIESGD